MKRKIVIMAMIVIATAFSSCGNGNRSGKTAETKTAEAQTAVDTTELKKMNWEKMKPGYAVPDFTLMGLDGKEMSLSDFKGKYVLLDFWGTWCRWCVKGLPEMKEYYARYADKIEFVGISCRESEEAWREGVGTHALPWTNLYNGYDQTLIVDYGIQGYPTKIILDAEGKVVEAFLGEDPALYEKLDEMFAQKS